MSERTKIPVWYKDGASMKKHPKYEGDPHSAVDEQMAGIELTVN